MLQTKAIIKILQTSGGYKSPIQGNSLNFQELIFTDYNSIEVNQSWDNMEQTAKIVLPRKTRKIIGYTLEDQVSFSPAANGSVNATISPYPSPSTTPFINDLVANKSIYSFVGSGMNENQFNLINGQYYRTNPLIQVGDVITIQAGYIIRNNGTEVDTVGDYKNLFNGITANSAGGNINPLYIDTNANIQRVQDSGDYSDILFYGYVTAVNIDISGNVTIDCEDYMWYLKKARVPNKVYLNNNSSKGSYYQSKNVTGQTPQFSNPKGYSINSILYDMCVPDKTLNNIPYFKGTNQIQQGNTMSGIQNIVTCPIPLRYTDTVSTYNGIPVVLPIIDISENIDTIIGDVPVPQISIYVLLKKIKEEYEIPSFFKINNYNGDPNVGKYQLYCTTFVYNNRLGNNTANFFQFQFGTNIIDSQLEYKDNSNLNAGAVIKSMYLQSNNITDDKSLQPTKKGKTKKQLQDVPVQVGDPTGPQYTFFYTTSNATITNSDATIIKQNMIDWGQQQLNKVTYTGYYGSFTSFGYPYVNWGDVIYISDPNIPERNGFYYVKRVITKSNFDDGLIQEITIDYKIAIGDPNNLLKK